VSDYWIRRAAKLPKSSKAIERHEQRVEASLKDILTTASALFSHNSELFLSGCCNGKKSFSVLVENACQGGTSLA
jgi:hypothetical protein